MESIRQSILVNSSQVESSRVEQRGVASSGVKLTVDSSRF